MKLIVIIVGLMAIVLIAEKYKDSLPTPLKQIYKVWELFSHVLGMVMSKILLTILWLLVFGPYAIVWKILHLRKKKQSSYWIDVDLNAKNDMKYQF
ncbi:MAG: hypothetical protein O2904_03980 [bacterium]|nr:hypothetical protein [bacterium]